ncbi:hypothetical protein AGMMS49957_11520 [Synergistales bacterium]|nr:hypothetical protein AGMMS49957_11520 [Synergistales bacterium]
MAKFARTFPEAEIVQTLSAQLMWSHLTTLLDKIKDREQLLWYAERNSENGWTVDMLKEQIDNQLYARQALTQKTSNFHSRLPIPQGDLAEKTMKDPVYIRFHTVPRGND